MPIDPASGLYFSWFVGPDGKPHRDFTHDASGKPQVDDRFDVDDDGNFIQVRDKPSGAEYEPGEWPEEAGAKELRPVARWKGERDKMPDDVREAVAELANLNNKIARARRKRGRGHG
jgi:hypothetical protein